MIRVYSMRARNGPAAFALAAVVLAVGALLVALGLLLLLGLVAIGAAIGTGAVLFRALTGRGRRRVWYRDLDPSLEIFPNDSAAQSPLRNPARVEGAAAQARAPE
jgi:hypothetical protein